MDFDVHGVVRIRVDGGSAADIAAVAAQLGLAAGLPSGDPDIVVRFVEGMPSSGPVRHVGVRDAAFTDESFLLVRGAHKSPVRVQLPLDQVGGPCEIVCESGLRAVPLLIAVVNSAALAKGVVPVHGAAFVHEGAGVLVTGWARGGKTETLLAFMARGASYVGDEWVYVTADGRMLGLPEPIKLWDWHLAEAPQFRAAVDAPGRKRLRRLQRMEQARRAVERASAGRGSGAHARLRHLLESQRFVHVPPPQLFGADRCALEAPLDKVVLVVSGDDPRVLAEPVEAEEIARRMAFSLEFERLDLRAAYLKFRFAFPERRNAVLDASSPAQRELFASALSGREAYVLHHPYPAPVPALYDALAPLVGERRKKPSRPPVSPLGRDAT